RYYVPCLWDERLRRHALLWKSDPPLERRSVQWRNDRSLQRRRRPKHRNLLRQHHARRLHQCHRCSERAQQSHHHPRSHGRVPKPRGNLAGDDGPERKAGGGPDGIESVTESHRPTVVRTVVVSFVVTLAYSALTAEPPPFQSAPIAHVTSCVG